MAVVNKIYSFLNYMIRAIANVEIAHDDVCAQQKNRHKFSDRPVGFGSELGELQRLDILQIERSRDFALLECIY